MYLLPQPKEIKTGDGTFEITDGTQIVLQNISDTGVLLAAHELAGLSEWGLGTDESAPCVKLKIIDTPEDSGTKRDGYRISISPESVMITGNSSAGLFYGIKTLQQIAETNPNSLPAMTINDEPDFANRGFYHDITRGKVPTLETMKEIVDFLADHKANQFQLYVEHTFAFSFDPRIAQNPDGLTAAEIIELDQYCADRFIDLVPSLQSFGHLAGVLSVPEYRQYAEIELTSDWDELTWHERMVGATLDTTNPEARALLKRMLDEYLPLFRSDFVNVCADETYDVGKGKGKEYAESLGSSGHLYLEHIDWLNEVCKSHGKRMMFWGDIVKKHPDLISEIPKDAILLNWGYYYETDFESTKLFKEASLDFYVCPGTSGWNEILNRMANADLNIRRYIETGKKYGALGVLNTDWGDHGHYNLLAGSWHGIALGACMSWNSGNPDQEEFDKRFNARMFGDPSGDGVKALRNAAFGIEQYGSWKCFYPSIFDLDSINNLYYDKKDITKKRAQGYIEKSEKAFSVFENYTPNYQATQQDLDEYQHMIQMMGMLGRKVILMRELEENGEKKNPELAANLSEFATDLQIMTDVYQDLWLARNKPSELHEIVEKLNAIIAECRTTADELSG